MQGLHARSLPVSAIPKVSTGGVPIDMFMRYSPVSDIIVDLGTFEGNEVALKRLTRFMERRKNYVTLLRVFLKDYREARRHWRVTVNKFYTESATAISLYKRESEQISSR